MTESSPRPTLSEHEKVFRFRFTIGKTGHWTERRFWLPLAAGIGFLVLGAAGIVRGLTVAPDDDLLFALGISTAGFGLIFPVIVRMQTRGGRLAGHVVSYSLTAAGALAESDEGVGWWLPWSAVASLTETERAFVFDLRNGSKSRIPKRTLEPPATADTVRAALRRHLPSIPSAAWH